MHRNRNQNRLQNHNTQNTHDGSIKNYKRPGKSAIEALQNGDKSWYTYFTENPEMTDDGQQVDFKSFLLKH